MKWKEVLRKGKYALLQSESDTEYVVASGYDPTQPENEQWDHGTYFTYWNNIERKPAALQEALDFFRSRTEDCHFVDKGEKYLEIYRSDYQEGAFREMLNCLNLSDDQVDEAFGIWFRVDEGSLKKMGGRIMEKYSTITEINPRWTNYDKSTAKAHLFNYGVIYLDEYGCPIDDEYLIEEIREGRSE